MGAADIYSVGIMLWESVAKAVPHAELSFGQVIGSVGWAGWIPDKEMLPDIPDDLEKLFNECWSFSPSDRPTAREVRTRLRLMIRLSMSKAALMLTSFLDGETLSKVAEPGE